MTSLGWSLPSYYARTRNSAWIVAAMLFLACAFSHTRAHAAAPAAKKPVRVKADLRGAPAERLEAAENALRRRDGAPRGAELEAAIARETNPQVRYRLLQALAAQDSEAAIPVLVRALRTDAVTVVRVAAAQELGRLDDRSATSALTAALAGDADLDVRRAAAASLGLHRSTEAVAGLSAAAGSPDSGLRRHAALALSRQPSGSVRDAALDRLARDADSGVSAAARAARPSKRRAGGRK